MEELPKLVTDLAYILIVAGIVTILFKRLNQPLVLGYIVAGFLAGPNMPYTPSISDNAGVGEWSQIGVIFLMFTLGLEFSFKKILKMGFRPVLAAVLVMFCMITVGSSVGYLFHWESMDRLFLGGMLAMSSTTIIYKAFDDLGMRNRKFASSVLSVLVLEDILGILLMVILSALAVTRRFEGTQLIHSLLQLGFFLVLWFIVGVYIVPIVLRKFKQYINSETLLIVSVGLCFLLVVMSSRVGYSPAFGAFMMGSIFAETVEAERIGSTISSLKDLFGAIFFVSVGMMVQPSILAQYWSSVLVIVIAVLVGQTIFGTISFLVSGHPLREALHCGFSLAQIGEFAFIIAALGEQLHVTSVFLYPVVVAVSIITTFLTPYMIGWAEPVFHGFDRILPNRVIEVLNKENGERRRVNPQLTLSLAWRTQLQSTLWQTVSYLTLASAIILFSFSFLLPLCRHTFTHWPGNAVCGIVTFLLISPCVRPIVMRKNHSLEAHCIRRTSLFQALLFLGLVLLKFAIGCQIIYYILNYLSPYWWVWHVLISMALMLLIIRSRRVKYVSIRMERTFIHNLSTRERREASAHPVYGRSLRGKDLHIASLALPANTAWGGKTLSQLRFGRTDSIHIAAIVRGTLRVNIPGGAHKLFPGDVLEVVGDDAGIESFGRRIQSEIVNPDSHFQQNAKLSLIQLRVGEFSPLCNHTLMELDLRANYHCMVVGIEDTNGNIQMIQANEPIAAGSLLWIVGEDADLSMLRMGI